MCVLTFEASCKHHVGSTLAEDLNLNEALVAAHHNELADVVAAPQELGVAPEADGDRANDGGLAGAIRPDDYVESWARVDGHFPVGQKLVASNANDGSILVIAPLL